MKTNPLKEGNLSENSAGIGTVTRKMVRKRAAELALIDGRSTEDPSKCESEQARPESEGSFWRFAPHFSDCAAAHPWFQI
jgi:hypothetical protein